MERDTDSLLWRPLLGRLNSPQTQTVHFWDTAKWREDSTGLSMLNFMTTQLEKDWTRTPCLEGLLEENLLGLVCKVASEQTSRPRSKCFKQTRPKWKRLAIMHSENQTAHQMSRSRWWRNDDLGWFCSHRTFQACSQSYALDCASVHILQSK